MGAEEDARKRYEDWVAGGGHDINAEAAARERGVENPYIVSEAAQGQIQAPPPTVSQISAPAPSVSSGQTAQPTLLESAAGPTNEYGIPIGGRTWKPVTTTGQGRLVTGNQWVDRGTPGGPSNWVNRDTGEPAPIAAPPPVKTTQPTQEVTILGPDGPISVPEKDYPRIQGDLDQLAREKARQRAFEEELKRNTDVRAERQVKVSEMLAAAEVAYRQALAQGADADRAQRYAQMAMDANLRQQQIDIDRMAQGARIVLEQRSAQERARQRRPFTRPTPTRIV